MENLNDVYWNSEESVTGLMERLGISRSTLYAAVEPLPVGSACSRCGGELVFTNRSARAAGRATCSQCGEATTYLPETTSAEESAEASNGPDGFGDELAERAGGMYQRVGEIQRELARARTQRASVIAGAFALGAAAGIAVAVLGRRLDWT
jgi:hypothetical protein